MIETGLKSPEPLDAEQFSHFKKTMYDFYVSQDVSQDGFIDMDELLQGALATFDCMDANKDGFASQDEISTGMTRCHTW